MKGRFERKRRSLLASILSKSDPNGDKSVPQDLEPGLPEDEDTPEARERLRGTRQASFRGRSRCLCSLMGSGRSAEED